MIKLKVPYNQKDNAKKLGCRWNAKEKFWYVPSKEYHNILNFYKWINVQKSNLILKKPFYIAKSNRQCWKCKKNTEVITLATRSLCYYDDENNLFKHEYLSLTFLSYIENLPQNLYNEINKQFNYYKKSYSKSTENSYYINHCKNCNVKLGDFFLHEEPGSAFFPITNDEMSSIMLYEFKSYEDYIVSASFDYLSNADTIYNLASKKILNKSFKVI